MKSFFLSAIASISVLFSAAQDQDKPKPPPASPPAELTATLASGAEIKISYSQPSVKGRTIGKNLEPMEGKVWRTGANDATVFETTKEISVEGKTLPAGKYSLFTIANPGEWTIIFNKTWKQWGAFKYNEADDILRVKVTPGKAPKFAEKMSFWYTDGAIVLLWGDYKVGFTVK